MTATNGIDAQVVKRWLGDALRVYDDLEAQKIDNMNRARIIRERLPGIYEAAKNAGLPLRPFKLSIKKVLLERKIEGLQEDIEDLAPEDEDDADLYEQMQEALGDFAGTPLGQAAGEAATSKEAKAAAKKQAKREAQEKAAAEDLAAQAAGDAQTAENVERLQAGIKPLPERESDEEFDDATSSKPSRRAQRSAKLDDLSDTQH